MGIRLSFPAGFLLRNLAEVENELIPVRRIDGDGDPHGLTISVEGRPGRSEAAHAPPAKRAMQPPICERTASAFTVSMISLAKAWISRRRASTRPIPRERR